MICMKKKHIRVNDSQGQVSALLMSLASYDRESTNRWLLWLLLHEPMTCQVPTGYQLSVKDVPRPKTALALLAWNSLSCGECTRGVCVFQLC